MEKIYLDTYKVPNARYDGNLTTKLRNGEIKKAIIYEDFEDTSLPEGQQTSRVIFIDNDENTPVNEREILTTYGKINHIAHELNTREQMTNSISSDNCYPPYVHTSAYKSSVNKMVMKNYYKGKIAGKLPQAESIRSTFNTNIDKFYDQSATSNAFIPTNSTPQNNAFTYLNANMM